MMVKVEKKRKGKPLFMVDIAVPRDLDPGIAELENVFLYDIDDLEGIVEANLQERKKAAEKIMLMIEKEIVEFKQWLEYARCGSCYLCAYGKKPMPFKSETMESLERKLPNLSERDIKVLNKHTKSIINQLLKDPILQAKELAARPDANQALDLFMKIFNIEELVAGTTIRKQPKPIKYRFRHRRLPFSHKRVHSMFECLYDKAS